MIVSKSPLNVLLGFVLLCIQLPTEDYKCHSLSHVWWCFLLDCSPEEALAASPGLFCAVTPCLPQEQNYRQPGCIRAASSCEARLGALDGWVLIPQQPQPLPACQTVKCCSFLLSWGTLDSQMSKTSVYNVNVPRVRKSSFFTIHLSTDSV